MKEPQKSRRLVPLLIGALCAALLLVVSTARAATPPAERTPGQKLFDEALELMAVQKYAEACPKLEETQRLEPSLDTQLSIADCYDKAGKTATAWRKFGEIVQAANQVGDTQRAQTANERATALVSRLCSIRVTVARPIAGLVVKRDGVVVDQGTLGTAVFVDPGKHEIEATAPNKKPWRMAVELNQPGAAVDVPILALQPLPPAPKPKVAPAAPPPGAVRPPPDRRQVRRTQQRTWALVSAGVGVVGLGVGTVLALSAQSTYKDADAYCDSANRCTDPQGVSLRQDAITRANLANIPFGIGLVGLGVGATLWFTAPAAQRPQPPTALVVTPSYVALRGKF